MRYGWCDKSHHCDFYALAIEDSVGRKIWLACVCVNYIGSEHRKTAFVDVLAEYVLAHLNVVVANDSHIIADVVAYISHLMAFVLAVVIEVIGSGLALQHVTPIYEKHIAWRFLNGISHKSMHSLKASFAPMVMPEVVRKVVSMYVGGKYYFKVYCVFAHLSLVLVRYSCYMPLCLTCHISMTKLKKKCHIIALILFSLCHY